jgi:hypothetical protein
MTEAKDSEVKVFNNIKQVVDMEGILNDTIDEMYVLFLCIDNHLDENWTDEEYTKLLKMYKEKIHAHTKKMFISSEQQVLNPFSDSGFDLFVPYVKNEVYIDGMNNKIVNLKVSAAVYKFYKVRNADKENPAYKKYVKPSPYYMYARSSMPLKTPFILANNVGIIDAGYRGNLGMILHNCKDSIQEVKSGTRMVQICMPGLHNHFHVRLVKELDNTERGSGGFGSTGQ